MPRALVTALLRDRATGRHFAVLNTHLAVLSKKSRLRSGAAVRRRVDELRAGEAVPAIVLDDLNARPDSPELRELLAGGRPLTCG